MTFGIARDKQLNAMFYVANYARAASTRGINGLRSDFTPVQKFFYTVLKGQ
jgi:hypothetical protein